MALATPLYSPNEVTVPASGDLAFSDARRAWRFDSVGATTPLEGTEYFCFDGEEGPATSVD